MLVEKSIFSPHIQKTFFQRVLVILKMDTGYGGSINLTEFNFKMCGLVLHQNSHHLGLYFWQVKTVIDIHTTAKIGSVCCRFSSFTEPPSVEGNLTMDQSPVSIFKITSFPWKKVFWTWSPKMLIPSNMHGDI